MSRPDRDLVKFLSPEEVSVGADSLAAGVGIGEGVPDEQEHGLIRPRAVSIRVNKVSQAIQSQFVSPLIGVGWVRDVKAGGGPKGFRLRLVCADKSSTMYWPDG